MSEPVRVRMVAASAFNLRGRRVLFGEEFETTAAEARELTVLGVAKPLRPEKEKRQYKRRDMQAE